MPDRILIVCNDLAYFTSHRYPALISREMLDAEVVVLSGGVRADTETNSQNIAFPVVPIACNRYRFSPFADCLCFVQLLMALFRFRPDVVHTITLKPNLLGGLAVRLMNRLFRRRIRLVAMMPGLGRVFSSNDNLISRFRRRCVTGLLRTILAGDNAMALVENSGDLAILKAAGIVRENGKVVAGAGVDVSLYSDAARDRTSTPRIVFASRLLRSKGVELVIEAAARLEASGRDVQFVIAGDADERDDDAVFVEARDLPSNTDFLGYCSDIPALLRTADVVLLPTTYQEGLPRILLEAAAVGRALIATDMEACRRIVEHDVNGFLLPFDGRSLDVDSIVAAIEVLARDPHKIEIMGKRSQELFWARGFDLASVRKQMACFLLPSLDRR